MENTLKLKADNDRMGTLVENLLKQGKQAIKERERKLLIDPNRTKPTVSVFNRVQGTEEPGMNIVKQEEPILSNPSSPLKSPKKPRSPKKKISKQSNVVPELNQSVEEMYYNQNISISDVKLKKVWNPADGSQ